MIRIIHFCFLDSFLALIESQASSTFCQLLIALFTDWLENLFVFFLGFSIGQTPWTKFIINFLFTITFTFVIDRLFTWHNLTLSCILTDYNHFAQTCYIRWDKTKILFFQKLILICDICICYIFLHHIFVCSC